MKKIKIQVVEDEGIVSIDIQNILNKLGYTISSVAYSGEEAIKKAEEAKPDLVLMDIGLNGEIDGVDAAKKIHDHLRIPVLFITGFADKHTLKRAKTAKPLGFVIKPIDERKLQADIEEALRKIKE